MTALAVIVGLDGLAGLISDRLGSPLSVTSFLPAVSSRSTRVPVMMVASSCAASWVAVWVTSCVGSLFCA